MSRTSVHASLAYLCKLRRVACRERPFWSTVEIPNFISFPRAARPLRETGALLYEAPLSRVQSSCLVHSGSTAKPRTFQHLCSVCHEYPAEYPRFSKSDPALYTYNGRNGSAEQQGNTFYFILQERDIR